MTTNKPKPAIYARSQRPDDPGLRRQITACRQLLSEYGHDRPVLYADADSSTARRKRPARAELIADIRAGKVSALAVYSVDRLYRSSNDLTELAMDLEEAGVELYIVGMGRRLDLAFLHIASAIVSDERDEYIRRIKAEVARRRSGEDQAH